MVVSSGTKQHWKYPVEVRDAVLLLILPDLVHSNFLEGYVLCQVYEAYHIHSSRLVDRTHSHQGGQANCSTVEGHPTETDLERRYRGELLVKVPSIP